MQKAEIVIIGGGVVGASVAYHLTQRGAKDVLVLESEPEQGRGSTGKATGGVRAQFETDINIQMSLYSLDFFKNCGFNWGYDPAGYLFFATDDDQLDYLKLNVESQLRLGVKGVSIIDRETIRTIVPEMNCEDIAGGSFGRNDGFIDPLAVMRGFTKAATDRGAVVKFNSPVLAINVKGGKVYSITTSNGNVESEKVVLCTGARAAELAATAGIDLPVEPIRRQIVWARTKNNLPNGLPMVIDIGSGFHFRPAREFGKDKSAGCSSASTRDVLFAYPDPDEKPSINTSVDESFIETVFEHARHRAEFLGDAEIVRDKCRAGLYEVTPDHHAILGSCDVEGLYFANGFSGHGVMHSPATGRALSEIILDGKSRFLDVECLHIDRFKTGRLMHETAFI